MENSIKGFKEPFGTYTKKRGSDIHGRFEYTMQDGDRFRIRWDQTDDMWVIEKRNINTWEAIARNLQDTDCPSSHIAGTKWWRNTKGWGEIKWKEIPHQKFF